MVLKKRTKNLENLMLCVLVHGQSKSPWLVIMIFGARGVVETRKKLIFLTSLCLSLSLWSAAMIIWKSRHLPCTLSESKKLGLNQMEKRGQSGACEWAKLSTLFPSLIGWNSSDTQFTALRSKLLKVLWKMLVFIHCLLFGY